MQLRNYLEEKLYQAFSEEWDPSRPTRFEIVDEHETCVLRLLSRRRNGSWSVVHEEPFTLFNDRNEVDNFVARALSIFLMNHHAWPR